MTDEIRSQISNCIKLIDSQPKGDYELNSWIPTCIECLNFALNNEQLLNEKPELYKDTLSTLSLLYSWIVENKEWAYIELRQKFRRVSTPEEVGNAFKLLFDKFNKKKNQTTQIATEFRENNGYYKSTYRVLNELSDMWNS